MKLQLAIQANARTSNKLLKVSKMSNIHDVFKDEEVNGVIVGGEYVCGYLYYGDKQANAKQLYAENDTILKEKAEELKTKMLEDNKDIKHWLFPDDSAWNLRIHL